MTADTVGGVWTYAIELARALQPHGVEVGLATMGSRLSLSQREQVESLPNVRLFESTFKLEWMEDPRADVERAGHWLLDLERIYKPDVVHLNGYSHGAFPWRCPKIVVGHSCVLSWWRAVHGCEAPDEWDEYREGVMAGLHQAELVVAPSRAMLKALEEHYGPFKATRVIYNGRSLPQLQQRPKHDFIFSAGRLWDAGKNVAGLAEVAPRLGWPVLVAGQESEPHGRTVSHRNISYLGQLKPDEVMAWMERAAIYALPARYEPFGLSALEAALAGCALVLGDIPSLREIWGDAALYAPPTDIPEMERVISSLCSDPNQIARLSTAAQSRARQYTPERMASEYLHAYAQALNTRRPQIATLDHGSVSAPAAESWNSNPAHAPAAAKH